MLESTMQKTNFLIWNQPSLYFLIKSILKKSVVHQQQVVPMNIKFCFREKNMANWVLKMVFKT